MNFGCARQARKPEIHLRLELRGIFAPEDLYLRCGHHAFLSVPCSAGCDEGNKRGGPSAWRQIALYPDSPPYGINAARVELSYNNILGPATAVGLFIRIIAKMPRSLRQLVGTFAHLIFYNHELTVNCDACQCRAPVSVPGLAARLGEQYRVQAFIERAVCSKCGARWPKLSVTVVPVKTAGYRSGS